MALRTSEHGDGCLDTRLSGLRLRIRPNGEFRMQQAVLIHAPYRQPPVLDQALSHQGLQAAPHLTFSHVAAHPNFGVRHLERFAAVKLASEGRKDQLREAPGRHSFCFSQL
jgi:hypothetical protein